MLFEQSFLESRFSIAFLLYSFGTLVLKGAAFFLIPIYTRVFTPDVYGQLVLLLIFISGGSILLGMGLHNYFPVEYFQSEGEQRKHNIARVFLFYLYIAVPITVLALAGADYINSFLFQGQISTKLVWAAILLSFASFFSDQYFTILKYQQRAARLVLIQVGVGLGELLLNILFVLVLEMGISGVILARVVRTALPIAFVVTTENIDISRYLQYLSWEDILSYT